MADPLCLVAAGANTSLGALVPAAAAARGGTVNPCALDLAAVPGGEGVRAAGHAADLAPSLRGPARLAALLEPAVADLRAAISRRNLVPGRIGLFLGLPAPWDAEPGVRGVPAGPGVRGVPAGPDAAGPDAAAQVAAKLVEALAFPLTTERLFPGGRAGTVQALAAACAALRQGTIDQAIVGGCESKVDPNHLAGSLASGRLKTEDYPVGFMPGEAAALLLLQSHADEPEALLSDPCLGQEERSYRAGGPPQGNALTEVLVRALEGAGDDLEGTVFLDLNGEPYRATDWALALARASVQAPIDRLRPELPVLTFGDVGAAYPALSIGLAARAFARGYARGPLALICTSADAGARAAVAVTAPPG